MKLDDLVKIELGCGKTKNPGYIGVDRFPFPGVDIVADLNRGLPFKDNYADVIFAVHSLEHLENLNYVMEEVFRVAKDNCIVFILAPYYNTFVNMANPYHKQVFNEDTFRFFCSDPENRHMGKAEWECPHALMWGLGPSDNSEMFLEFAQIGVEFFYFPNYAKLNKDIQLRARRSLSNVCDQVFYTLIVNKTKEAYSNEEYALFREKTQLLEPEIIQILRDRDRNANPESSLITDIVNLSAQSMEVGLKESNSRTEALAKNMDVIGRRLSGMEAGWKESNARTEALAKDMKVIGGRLSGMEAGWKESNARTEALAKDMDVIGGRLSGMEAGWKESNSRTEALAKDMDVIGGRLSGMEAGWKESNSRTEALFANVVDLLKYQEAKSLSSQYFFDRVKKNNFFEALRLNHQHFMDAIVLNALSFRRNSIIKPSLIIPFDGYLEYRVEGYGESFVFFLFGSVGSKLFFELVYDGRIVHQTVVSLGAEGKITLAIPFIKGVAYARFRAVDNLSILRVLEIVNRRWGLLTRNSLASYIE